MIYLSVCSGIEAASVAWHGPPLNWKPFAFAEIDPFASAVLAHRYPETPNLGDFTAIEGEPGSIDLLVGGTPCQSFSVAGLRGGMADARGNLALEFLRLAGRLRPEWVVWENVPGVLSSGGGRDFGAFLGGLVDLGYGFAYRVLDAQFFGLAQRRNRVFVVGRLGNWRGPAAVLLERGGLSGHPPPRREAEARVAGCLDARATAGGFPGTDGACGNHVVPVVARSLAGHHGRYDGDTEDFVVTHTLRADGFDALEDGTGRGTPLVPVAFHDTQDPISGEVVPSLPTNKGSIGVRVASGVRRLTPRECERLQGFPDNWTAVPYRGKLASDGPRYRAIGNSMAVPVMRWIGERIAEVQAIGKEA